MEGKRKADISNENKDMIKQAFDIFDEDKNGNINAKEFKYVMRALGLKTSPEEIKKMIASADKDGNDSVDFKEFFELMKSKIEEASTVDIFKKVFKMFDIDDRGKISFDNLKTVTKELKIDLSDEDLHIMIDESDKDKDKHISEAEFLKVMTKSGLM